MSKPLPYVEIDAVNWSSLKVLRVSPLHYQAALRTPRADTPALAMGRAVHTAVLEPDCFVLDYAVYRESKSKGEGAVLRWRAFQEANKERTILSVEEYETCLRMRDAVRSHPRAAPYLAHGKAEQIIRWTDAATGLACKARLDWVSHAALVDLKTGRAVDPRRFGTAAAQFLYHGQLAFYGAGLKAACGQDLPVVLIAVESEAPHDVVVYRLDEEAVEEGQALVRELLDELAERRRTGDWPGIDRGKEQVLTLPRWAVADTSEADGLGLTFGSEP